MDEQQIRAAVATAVEQAMGELGGPLRKSVQALTERLAQVEETAKAGTGLKAEDVKRLVAEGVGALRTEITDQKAKAETSEKVRQARQAYIDQHGAKIPAAYLAAVPETDDEAALKAGVEKATGQLKADLASGKYAMKAADLGASAPSGAGKPPLDPEKLSPTDKIAAGLAAQQK